MISTNKDKKSLMIDKKLWSTSATKMKVMFSLTDKRYKAKTLKRVYIAKKGKNIKNPLEMPTINDRAILKKLLIYTLLKSFIINYRRMKNGAKKSQYLKLNKKITAKITLKILISYFVYSCLQYNSRIFFSMSSYDIAIQDLNN